MEKLGSGTADVSWWLAKKEETNFNMEDQNASGSLDQALATTRRPAEA
ncbi:MAG: hypothetical protein OS130_05730 [Thermodesulfobacteriota bacterium]|jgi:hypothetical protein|nr:MAG: hypothetical protein OS130_05730 [Thermodesulfobacteriota bacterium]